MAAPPRRYTHLGGPLPPVMISGLDAYHGAAERVGCDRRLGVLAGPEPALAPGHHQYRSRDALDDISPVLERVILEQLDRFWSGRIPVGRRTAEPLRQPRELRSRLRPVTPAASRLYSRRRLLPRRQHTAQPTVSASQTRGLRTT
jgi:hypothetical protein